RASGGVSGSLLYVETVLLYLELEALEPTNSLPPTRLEVHPLDVHPLDVHPLDVHPADVLRRGHFDLPCEQRGKIRKVPVQGHSWFMPIARGAGRRYCSRRHIGHPAAAPATQ